MTQKDIKNDPTEEEKMYIEERSNSEDIMTSASINSSLCKSSTDIKLTKELIIMKVDNGYMVSRARDRDVGIRVYNSLEEVTKYVENHYKELDIRTKLEKLKE